MGIVQVVYDGRTLIDTSQVTVQPETLFQGETALGADGEVKTGTFTIQPELTQQDSLIAQLKTALQGKAAGGTVETWTLTMEDGTEIEKQVVIT